MADASDLRRLALALEGTTEAPHFDRTAFRVARIFATLAADGRTANLKFSREEQEFKVLLAPEAFRPVANAWGRQGWTTVELDRLTVAALELAWRHALPRSRESRRAQR
ncbi:MAG TPA: MmcQ/YjbR family DNA-binding protein [Devosiaceae bacterium]|nr:MmcQ/YjbR family DNA-binding protein [Devosiaceae bacterium]